ncbi:MAG: gliding motility-associated C-terminal domain-containing protein [Bacteroidales bacterium]|nr:gliding motility-associated C-terminal domain-containing protein [Candidatus Colimorpha onthohippi]
MKRNLFILFTILLSGTLFVHAQNSVMYKLNASLNGQTLSVPIEGLQVSDDDNNNTYTKNADWTVTIDNTETSCSQPYTLALSFSLFDINPLDTLFIYDGPSVFSNLLVAATNTENALKGGRSIVYASPTNNANVHALTIRFKTANHSGANAGFLCSVECLKPCEVTTPHIDFNFDRVRHGQIYASDTMRWDGDNRVVTICAGEGVRIHGYADYTHFTGHYTPTDESSSFKWTFDDDSHVRSGLGQNGYNYVTYNDFDSMGCHNLILEMSDANGCVSTLFDQIQLRVAANPIRTIGNMGTICSNDELLVEVSYNPMDVVSLDTVEISNIHSRVNDVKTFIPDGPNCAVRCYGAPVTFSEFKTGATVVDKGDICSICVNYEHSYMGDYDLKIVCPSGRQAVLKYKDAPGGYPAGAGGGGGMFTGYPYGGNNHEGWDGGSGRYCDSVYNMYGIGLDYCFSRNGNYMLVDGRAANTAVNANHYLGNSQYVNAVSVNFPPRPARFVHSGSGNAGTNSFSTKHGSNHAAKSDYYKPADDFSSLVGCPLNGTWKIEICDNWAIDNGWVFSWGMDLCNAETDEDCVYQVGIDSITWDVRPEIGRTSAAEVRRDRYDPYKFYMSAKDTAGYFYANMHVFDEYGCQWDSVGYFTVLWVPEPELGENGEFCRQGAKMFTAQDRHTYGIGYYYTYKWSTGDTTQSITPLADRTTDYMVEVSNHSYNGSDTRCVGYDTVSIVVGIHPKPIFGFDTLPQLRQCSPFTVQFDNRSEFASQYVWDFGDGTQSTDVSPRHTYLSGTYTVTLYALTDDGCRDTLKREKYIKSVPPTESVVGAMMCFGDEYTWIDGVTYREPTTKPMVVLRSVDGCDSILHLNLGLDMTTKAQIHVSPDVASYAQSYVCLHDYGINSYTRTWWLPDGSTSNSAVECIEFPTEEDSVRVVLAIESEYGCKDTTYAIIPMDKSQVWMPNVFTPMAPNNKVLRVGHNQVEQYECNIYNRSGHLVFSSKNPDEEWDGTYKDKPCPQGVYVYMIRYTTKFDSDRWQIKKGTVTLIR